MVELWPVELQQPLPIIPVPLREPDDDVVLDLGRALNEIDDEAAYDLSIDYDQPPPPPAVSGTEAAWMQAFLSNLKSGIGRSRALTRNSKRVLIAARYFRCFSTTDARSLRFLYT